MLLKKEDLPKVDYQGMNIVHERELEIVNRLYAALKEGVGGEELERLLDAFIEDVVNHFSYEEDLMRKSRFFAYECHAGEHKRVLEELNELRNRWQETGNREELLNYLENTFKPWIVEHVLTMDTVTAQWLSRVMAGVFF